MQNISRSKSLGKFVLIVHIPQFLLYMRTKIVRQLGANFAWSKLTMNCMAWREFQLFGLPRRVQSGLYWTDIRRKETIYFSIQYGRDFFFIFLYHSLIIHGLLNNLISYTSYLDSKNYEVNGNINCGGSNYPWKKFC